MSILSLLLLLCLLLAALHPFSAAAARNRELLMVAAGHGREAKLARTEAAAKEAARKRVEESSTDWRHFRTRKLPPGAKSRFDGRVPLTADYSGIQGHPSKHH